MQPTKNSIFKPFTEINNYCDKNKYFCTAVVFSPETENNHFNGCPPYIEINEVDDFKEDKTVYFKIPEIIAYYAKVHAGFTMKGSDNYILQGEQKMRDKIRSLLNIE